MYVYVEPIDAREREREGMFFDMKNSEATVQNVKRNDATHTNYQMRKTPTRDEQRTRIYNIYICTYHEINGQVRETARGHTRI